MAAFHAGGPQLVATAFSHRRPSRRGKSRCFAIGLSLPFRHRAVFASRLTDCKALLCLGCAHRARTAKLLRTGQRRSQWGTFSGGGRAPAPPQMAKQSLRHWLSAEQSCRARPVRAPKEGHWPRQWQSASHKPRAAAMACERSALRSPLSHPLACEREALRPILSHPLPGKRP